MIRTELDQWYHFFTIQQVDNMIAQPPSRSPLRGVWICALIGLSVSWLTVASSVLADEFTNDCLSALSASECSPYVACEAHTYPVVMRASEPPVMTTTSTPCNACQGCSPHNQCDAHACPPILRTNAVSFVSTKPVCQTGPRPEALQCCPYMSVPDSYGKGHANGGDGTLTSGRWQDVYEATYGEKPSLLCQMQYKFVNWRFNSMYLEGCMPAGYTLSEFIQTVPSVEFHDGLLNSTSTIEPGGSATESQTVEGDDRLSLSQISLNIAPPAGSLPENQAKALFEKIDERTHLAGTTRDWGATTESWNASLLNHQPLYFEDVNLERHGFSHGICQPLYSGVRFFGTIPMLPYLIGANPPNEMVYSLGETRPGDDACYLCEVPPVSLRGTVFQAVTTTGLIFLIP